MKRIHYILILLIALLPAYTNAMHKKNAELDALCRKINTSTSIESYLSNCRQLEIRSRELKQRQYEEIAYNLYIYYSVTNHITEEPTFWLNKLDSLTRITKDKQKRFVGHYLAINRYNQIDDYTTALTLSNKMFREASKLNDKFCLKLAVLGFFNTYVSSAQFDNAFEILSLAYPDGLPKKWDKDVDILVLCNIIGAYGDIGKEHEAKVLLDQLGKYVTSFPIDKVNFSDPDKLPLAYYIASFSYNISKAMMLVGKGELQQSKVFRDKINVNSNGKNNTFRELCMHIYNIQYYQKLNKQDSVLYETEKALQFARNIGSKSLEGTYLTEKARLLKDKNIEQSILVYDSAAVLLDSIANDKFFKHMGEFTAQYKADNYRESNEIFQQQKSNLYWLIGSLITIIVLFVFLWFFGERVRRRLKKAKILAERSEQFKLIFFANMNHEIRTPLGAIAGFSDLLIEETDEQTRKEYAEIIHENNDQLSRLISDVLDISKIEAGTIAFSYSTFDVPEMMHSVYNTIRLRIPERVTFTLDPGQPMKINADKGRVIQVIINFLTNSIKHTESGFIRMGYAQIDDTIRFYVSDSGTGVAPEQQEEIFTRFVQETEKKGGVGLGLALCKGFINKMNGEIGVISQLNEGSIFWFTLPINGIQPE